MILNKYLIHIQYEYKILFNRNNINNIHALYRTIKMIRYAVTDRLFNKLIIICETVEKNIKNILIFF